MDVALRMLARWEGCHGTAWRTRGGSLRLLCSLEHCPGSATSSDAFSVAMADVQGLPQPKHLVVYEWRQSSLATAPLGGQVLEMAVILSLLKRLVLNAKTAGWDGPLQE